MSRGLFIAILAGCGGMLGWGFSEFATKKSVDRIGTICVLVWAHAFGTLILFFSLLLKALTNHVAIDLPAGPGEWFGLLFFGTLQTTVYYFAYKGFEKGEVSILSPIFASFAGLVALLSVSVFGEVVRAALVPALVLIFGGVLLINLDWCGLKTRRIRITGVAGFREILVATILATVWTLGWDKFTGGKDWMLYTTLMFLFMTISAYLLARLRNIGLLKVESGVWKFLWFIAIGEVVAYLGITLGYASTSYTSVVAILSGASSLPTIVLARIFLKERMTPIQTIASVIIITGIVLLSLA